MNAHHGDEICILQGHLSNYHTRKKAPKGFAGSLKVVEIESHLNQLPDLQTSEGAQQYLTISPYQLPN